MEKSMHATGEGGRTPCLQAGQVSGPSARAQRALLASCFTPWACPGSPSVHILSRGSSMATTKWRFCFLSGLPHSTDASVVSWTHLFSFAVDWKNANEMRWRVTILLTCLLEKQTILGPFSPLPRPESHCTTRLTLNSWSPCLRLLGF